MLTERSHVGGMSVRELLGTRGGGGKGGLCVPALNGPVVGRSDTDGARWYRPIPQLWPVRGECPGGEREGTDCGGCKQGKTRRPGAWSHAAQSRWYCQCAWCPASRPPGGSAGCWGTAGKPPDRHAHLFAAERVFCAAIYDSPLSDKGRMRLALGPRSGGFGDRYAGRGRGRASATVPRHTPVVLSPGRSAGSACSDL
ncbi:hypothetical protein AAFF_G00304870 [Aldrovandia affinis]|uniref:Uncharacterized protein n=1 Tax=Aldrovandia affinis TaxID=143900 RepID=A0AAD7WR16_9TELE|nr:hypothetical protein AAFF_G00304870 [Aldrovandia affinis]